MIKIFALGVAAFLSTATLTPAQAIPITVSFTATGFTPLSGTDPAPTDPVTGTIVYDAASTTSTINSFISVDLTIGGHTYSVGELVSGTFIVKQFIGGAPFGFLGVQAGTDDLALGWDQAGLGNPILIYATAAVPGSTWSAGSFTQFSITAAPVPEPGSLLLLGAGLLTGLVAMRRAARPVAA
jgi:hypothetical protein